MSAGSQVFSKNLTTKWYKEHLSSILTTALIQVVIKETKGFFSDENIKFIMQW